MKPIGPDHLTVMGMRIVSSPFIQPVAKIQLSADLPWCTPSFRAETNRWFLEQFGTRDVAYMMSGPFGDYIAMNPKQVAMLRNLAPSL